MHKHFVSIIEIESVHVVEIHYPESPFTNMD